MYLDEDHKYSKGFLFIGLVSLKLCKMQKYVLKTFINWISVAKIMLQFVPPAFWLDN